MKQNLYRAMNHEIKTISETMNYENNELYVTHLKTILI